MKPHKIALVLGSVVGLATAVPAQANDTIRILCPNWSGFAPIFVAQDLGYFKKLGIKVDIKFDDDIADQRAAMARGDIEMDLHTVGEYQGRPRSPTMPGIIIGTIDQSVGGDGVIAAGDITSVAQLQGKIVASEPNIPGRLLLQLELKKVGLSFNNLKLRVISSADSVAVFADSSVAAVVSYQPYLSQVLKVDAARHPHELVSSAQFPGYITDVMIVRDADLMANPEKYRKFLIGIYQAVAFFEAHPNQFIKLAAPAFGLSPQDFRDTIYGSLTYTDLAESQALIGTPIHEGKLYGVFRTVMQLNLENGAADHLLSAKHSIDPGIITGITAKDLE